MHGVGLGISQLAGLMVSKQVTYGDRSDRLWVLRSDRQVVSFGRSTLTAMFSCHNFDNFTPIILQSLLLLLEALNIE
jgi:hypothetical protein